MKTNPLARRIALSMKTRKGWIDIADRCIELNIPSLAISAQKQVNKIDAKIIRMIAPHLSKKVEIVGEITDADIARAKEYPIEDLFPDAKNGMVRCIFHKDERPSASIKKGFFNCFSCGAKADVIKCYQVIHGATFIESVKIMR